MMYALVLLLTLGWTGVSQAAITCSNPAVGSSALASPTLAVTVPAQTNRITGLGIHDRSESATISSVSDTGSGTWTLRAGPESSGLSTIRTWLYERTGGSDGAITITINFSGAVNSAFAAGTCYSDTAALNFVSAATSNDNASGTAQTSNTREFTNTGVLFGYIGTNNNSTVSAVGTNQTNFTNTATQRIHLITRAESSGTHGLDITLSASSNGLFGAALYQEAAAGGAETFGFRLRVVQ